MAQSCWQCEVLQCTLSVAACWRWGHLLTRISKTSVVFTLGFREGLVCVCVLTQLRGTLEVSLSVAGRSVWLYFCTETDIWLHQTHRTSALCSRAVQSSSSRRAPPDSVWSLTCFSSEEVKLSLSFQNGACVVEQRYHFCLCEGLCAPYPDPCI